MDTKRNHRNRREAARTFLGVLLLTLAVAAPLLPLLGPTAQATTIELLPAATTYETGYTHRMVVQYTDLTNAAAAVQTITLLPPTTPGGFAGSLPTNFTVAGFAYVLDQSFTNTAANNTNLLLYVGFGGTVATGLATNSVASALDIDTRSLAVQCTAGNVGPLTSFSTNCLFTVSGSTNTLVAVFKQAGGTPLLSSVAAGKITLLFKLQDNQQLKR